jgi:hypothetical protein
MAGIHPLAHPRGPDETKVLPNKPTVWDALWRPTNRSPPKIASKQRLFFSEERSKRLLYSPPADKSRPWPAYIRGQRKQMFAPSQKNNKTCPLASI